MPLVSLHTDAHPNTYDFLLFRAGSFLFGADAAQVSGIRRMVRSETGLSDNFLNLKDILHLTSQRETAQEHTLLEVKSTVARTYIEVDSADGVIPLNLSQIRKLPPLVDTQKVHPCLWGLALLDDKVAFIVDLDVLTSG